MTKQTGQKARKQDASPPLVEEERDVKEGPAIKKLKHTEAETRNAEYILPEEFKLLHRYWMASNYLSVGQVSLHQFIFYGYTCFIILGMDLLIVAS